MLTVQEGLHAEHLYLKVYNKLRKQQWHQVFVPEWLSGMTRNHMGSARAGSNPAEYALLPGSTNKYHFWHARYWPNRINGTKDVCTDFPQPNRLR